MPWPARPPVRRNWFLTVTGGSKKGKRDLEATRDHPDRGQDRLIHQEFVQTARRYRTVDIRAGRHILPAEDPLSANLRDALALVT